MPFNFGENSEVSDINTVPEEFRGAYEQNGDKFSINPAAAHVTKAFDGIASTLAATRQENDTLQGQVTSLKAGKIDLSSLSAYGTTVDEIKTGVETAIADARKKAGNTGAEEVERVRSELTAAKDQAITAANETIGKLENQVVDLMFKADAIAAIGEAKGNASMLLPMLQGERLVEKGEDGVIRIFVADADGKKRYGNDGNPLTFAQRIAELKADETFAGVFESDLGDGGGAPPNGQDALGRRQRNRQNQDNKSSTDKIADGLRRRQGRR